MYPWIGVPFLLYDLVVSKTNEVLVADGLIYDPPPPAINPPLPPVYPPPPPAP